MQKTRAKKSTWLTDWLTNSKNKKIVYWLTDWLEEQKNRLLIRFVDMKMLYVNFSFNSRKFVLWLRDFLKKLELKIKWNTFIVFKEKTSHIDDFLLTRVLLRAMKILFLLASSTSNWRFFLTTRVSLRAYLTILFNYSRISTSNSQKQNLIE